MSKYVNVPTGNYSVIVQSGGTITLDTGPQTGDVTVTGNLPVQGTTTTVTSQNLDIRDNILTLNSGETGAGITLDDSGLEMDRGTFVNALFTFNENIQWSDPVTDTTKTGGFVFKDANNALVGIRTNNINTGGGDLYLINAGTGTVSVTGTTNYDSGHSPQNSHRHPPPRTPPSSTDWPLQPTATSADSRGRASGHPPPTRPVAVVTAYPLVGV